MKYVNSLKLLAICLLIFAQVTLAFRSRHRKKAHDVRNILKILGSKNKRYKARVLDSKHSQIHSRAKQRAD